MTPPFLRRPRVAHACVVAIPLLLWLGLLAVSGCKPLVIRAELLAPVEVSASLATVEYAGTFVSEQLYTKIDVNRTSEAYLIALLGPPDQHSDLGEGRALLLYRYRPTSQSASLVSLLGVSGELDPRFVTTAFEIREGVVVEKIRG